MTSLDLEFRSGWPQEMRDLFRIMEPSVQNFFERISTEKGWENLPDRELLTLRRMDGARIFKKKALGLWGYIEGFRVDRTVEEMMDLLIKTGITTSIEEGRRIVPQLYGTYMQYSEGNPNMKDTGDYLFFERVEKNGEDGCGIFTYFD
jgi:hypothetical protein|tara:strand:+ start:6697 stop:7140 length:444 start_codon:yes stop_codon:yes gene_type:complete